MKNNKTRIISTILFLLGMVLLFVGTLAGLELLSDPSIMHKFAGIQVLTTSLIAFMVPANFPIGHSTNSNS